MDTKLLYVLIGGAALFILLRRRGNNANPDNSAFLPQLPVLRNQ